MKKYFNKSTQMGRIVFADGGVQFLLSRQLFETSENVVSTSRGIIVSDVEPIETPKPQTKRKKSAAKDVDENVNAEDPENEPQIKE